MKIQLVKIREVTEYWKGILCDDSHPQSPASYIADYGVDVGERTSSRTLIDRKEGHYASDRATVTMEIIFGIPAAVKVSFPDGMEIPYGYVDDPELIKAVNKAVTEKDLPSRRSRLHRDSAIKSV